VCRAAIGKKPKKRSLGSTPGTPDATTSAKPHTGMHPQPFSAVGKNLQ
jgi:hypothetical protein